MSLFSTERTMATNNLTRRGFLRGSASAVAFPYVITTAALGNETKSAASERVTLSHIGVGGQGSYLFSQFQKVKGAQSVACADAYKDRRELRAAQCGGKAYADFGRSSPATTSTPWSWPRPTTGTCRSRSMQPAPVREDGSLPGGTGAAGPSPVPRPRSELFQLAKPPQQPRGGNPIELEKRPRAGRRGKCHDATFLELERESTDLAQDQQADQVAERRVVA